MQTETECQMRCLLKWDSHTSLPEHLLVSSIILVGRVLCKVTPAMPTWESSPDTPSFSVSPTFCFSFFLPLPPLSPCLFHFLSPASSSIKRLSAPLLRWTMLLMIPFEPCPETLNPKSSTLIFKPELRTLNRKP